MLSIVRTADTVTRSLRGLALKGRRLRPVLRAIGIKVVSISKGSHDNPSLRQSSWPDRWDGSASRLIKRGTLRRSIRISQLDDKSVTVSSDRHYAAIHQLGGVIVPKNGKFLVFKAGGRTIFAKRVTIPARPFLPFTPDGKVARKFRRPIRAITVRASRLHLGIS